MTKKLTPIHPGKILLEDFMEPHKISQNKLSIALGVDIARINNIVNENRSITPDTAMRLGVYFKTGPKVWLNLQQEYDLRIAENELKEVLAQIKPLKTVPDKKRKLGLSNGSYKMSEDFDAPLEDFSE